MNLHFGCGMSPGDGWYNCDSSPTLWLQRLPVAGFIFRRLLKPCFLPQIHYDNIVRGLSIPPASCDVIYCSHVLEHLALDEFRAAIRNVRRYLKPGGVFRAVLPNLAEHVKVYLENPEPDAAHKFLTWSGLGRASRPHGLLARLRASFGGSAHLWMWDFKAMKAELEQAGFRDVRPVKFGDSPNPAFAAVEIPERYKWNSLAFECSC